MDFRHKKDFVVLLKAKVIKNIESKLSDNDVHLMIRIGRMSLLYNYMRLSD